MGLGGPPAHPGAGEVENPATPALNERLTIYKPVVNRPLDRISLRFLCSLALLLAATTAFSQQSTLVLPDAPSATLVASAAAAKAPELPATSSSATPELTGAYAEPPVADAPAAKQSILAPKVGPGIPVDADGNPIPLERREPTRILGLMPNFRTVSGGAKPPPPGWKYNFTVADHQAFDYSTFIFLGLTSVTAEGMDSHPALGKGIGGFYNYTWRGFLDKTDNTHLSAWLLPSALHEDTRFYALGSPHSIPTRALYVISRQAVARTYGGSQTPNIAGLGGKVLTQVISRYYYPSSTTSFDALATKFGYSVMRDVAFSAVREFYPDIAAHYIRKHREKILRQQQQQP